MPLLFTKNEYKDRLNKVRAAMDMASMDALLLTKPESMYYLSGYLSPPVYRYQSMILPRNGDMVLILAEIEKKLAQETTWFRDIIGFTDLDDPLYITKDMLESLKLGKANIGIEKNDISGYLPITVYEKLINLLPGATLCDASDLVGEVRLIKSDSEIECMRTATRICQEGMKAGIAALRVGLTECQVAGEMYRTQMYAGCDTIGLPIFVGSGYRSSIPHCLPTEKKLAAGDVVQLETSGVYQKYSTCMLRCAYLGDPPDDVKKIHLMVKESLKHASDAIRPGAKTEDIDRAARRVIHKAGYGKYFTLRAGYSAGIGGFPPTWVTEPLDIVEGDKHIIEPNMTINIEIHMPLTDWGIRLGGETHLVTNDGNELLIPIEIGHELYLIK